MIVTSSRRATIDELAAECDRRGEVIDRLQAELAALRIAADQMTEREKVVAYINALIEALPPIYDGERKILSRVVMDIERGDHSSAKPASPTPDTSHA